MTAGIPEPDGSNGGERQVRHIRHGFWEVRIYSLGVSDGGFVSVHADLHREGRYICRIVLAHQFHDEWLAANALQAKAADWIEDWNQRDHSGTTGFTEL